MKIDRNKIDVNAVFEIQLRIDTWTKVVECAELHDVTFSWITRLCLFELVKNYKELTAKIDLESFAEKEQLQKDKEQNKKLHRHKICLYGDDAVLIRFVAHKLGLTISQVVRVCIRMYIQNLFTHLERSYLVKNGIKFLESVVEKQNSFTKSKYLSSKFWKYNPGFGKNWGWIFDYS